MSSMNFPLEWLLSCELILYAYVLPSETGSQSDILLKCLTDLHNSQ